MPFWLKNPHSAEAVLKVRPRDVLSVSLPKKQLTGAWDKVEKLARENRVQIQFSGGGGGKSDGAGGRHSIAQVQVKDPSPVAPEELFSKAKERKMGKGLWLALDQVQDPHNLGAIFRSASFFGVQGILMTQERSAPITDTVCDTACGGVEYVPFSIQPSLKHGLDLAKEAGLWVLGTSEHAKEPLSKIEKDRPWLLVLGNEEQGMRRLTEESCDLLCRIPPQGDVHSLNVSVASGIMISYLS